MLKYNNNYQFREVFSFYPIFANSALIDYHTPPNFKLAIFRPALNLAGYLLGVILNMNTSNSKWILALEWAVLIAIIVLATWLRYWRIGEVPPGFNSDEAVGAVGALTTLREGLQYSYEGQGGGGALGFYFAAAAFYLFGPSIATIRGLAAWAGVVSIFANYWAIRETFRSTGLNRARVIAALSTLGLAVSLWHVSASRIAFAGIGVPFLMLPSVYFLWLGLNKPQTPNPKPETLLPFIASGIFLGALLYIYLSGAFAPPFYAAFFVGQWFIVKLCQKLGWTPNPPQSYLTTHFWKLTATAATAAVVILPIVYVVLLRPELEPGTTRASQAFFLNPQINQGDPWGLLWRSVVGNFEAYGVSLKWLILQRPNLALMQWPVGLLVFLGFLLSLWYSLRGQAAYLFNLLWFGVMLLPSILSPDQIPHNLRAIGATTPTYVFVAIFIVWLFDTLWAAGRRWLLPRLSRPGFTWTMRGVGLAAGAGLILLLWQANIEPLYRYFYIFPQTNDAKAAYHVYAVEMANVINDEESSDVAFILPRNTAAGDVFRNFTTDFLTELAQPPAAHYWVIDDERTLPHDLTTAAAGHDTLKVVQWKTSKHTNADPKDVITYYLEKYGHYDRSDGYEYFNVHTYKLDTPAPDFSATETLQPTQLYFGNQLWLTGFALGDAGNPENVARPQASSNSLIWLRLGWQKTGQHPEDLKVSAQIYTQDDQLVAQTDKLLLSNILQVGSSRWPGDAQEDTYVLMRIPRATPPGSYSLYITVYGASSLQRLYPTRDSRPAGAPDRRVKLADLTVTPGTRPVELKDLNIVLPVDQQLLPGLTLAGFETLPGDTVRPGERVELTLIWQAGDPPPAGNLEMSLAAKSEDGRREWALSQPVKLAGPSYPTHHWRPNEILRGWISARVPSEAESGLYKLRLRLTQAGQPEREVVTLPIGDFHIQGWTRNFDSPQPQAKIGADYGGLATLVGLDVASTTLAPGDTLNLRLYWRADGEFAKNHAAFVQLIGPDGRLHGQVDQTPGAGQYPTTGWLPGEYIADDYAIPLAADAPPGDYQIAVGLYDPASGQRLPVNSSGCQPDVCLLPGLTVK